MRKEIKIPLYFGKLVIIQEKDWKPIIKKYNLEENIDKNYSVVSFAFKGDYYIVFKEVSDAMEVAHDSLHIVTLIFEDIRAHIDNTNDEPAAYLLGWVVGQITKCINIDNSKL